MRALALALLLAVATPTLAAPPNDVPAVGVGGGLGMLAPGMPQGQAGVPVVAVTDWSSSFLGIWRFNEASGTRANSGTVGSGLNLPQSGTVASSSTAVELPLSIVQSKSANDFLAVANAAVQYSGNFFVGCYLYRTGSTSAVNRVIQNASTGANTGWILDINTDGGMSCSVGNATAYTVAHVTTATPLNDWRFATCNYSSTTITAEMLGTTAVTNTGGMTAATSVSMTVGSSTVGNAFPGNIDLCITTNKSLTAAQKCRLASCGVAGELGCSCSQGTPATYVSTGLNTVYAGGCTLPACNAAAP